MKWIGEDYGIVSSKISEAEQHGRSIGKFRGNSPELAAFVANLHKPVGVVLQEDLTHLEDFLHGYYGETIRKLRETVELLSVRTL